MKKIPRYTQKRLLASGITSYRFNPPQYLIDRGITQRVELGSDPEEVRSQATVLNKQLDDERRKLTELSEVRQNSTVNDLVVAYKKSNDFNMLRETSKVEYTYLLSVLCKQLGMKRMSALTSKEAKRAYEDWVSRGIHFANHVCSCSSKVFNYAIDMEYTTFNPFRTIKRKIPKKRKVVWTRENVIEFLDYCYSKFEYRNIGLIVNMAYDWCQRIGDMRCLEWESIDLNKQLLSLEQSKRRARVYLPISDELANMLRQQEKDFGFQRYVAPAIKPSGGEFKPYNRFYLSRMGRKIISELNLPTELRLMDLRRTGVTEMVESGVDITQIMSVTGHSSVTSVQPYIKNTYRSANNALTRRNSYLNT